MDILVLNRHAGIKRHSRKRCNNGRVTKRRIHASDLYSRNPVYR
jgi:hypothetical protein